VPRVPVNCTARAGQKHRFFFLGLNWENPNFSLSMQANTPPTVRSATIAAGNGVLPAGVLLGASPDVGSYPACQ
jgi:hypothetical protein